MGPLLAGLRTCLRNCTIPGAERCDHTLLDIVAITLLASLCGADDWPEVEVSAEREPWLRTFWSCPRYPFARHLRAWFACWSVSNSRRLVPLDPGGCTRHGGRSSPIDGKTARRFVVQARSGLGALHLITAWATESGLTLGQWPVPRSPTRSRPSRSCSKLLDITVAQSPLMRWHSERNRGAGYRAKGRVRAGF